MKDEPGACTDASAATTRIAYPTERARYKALLLTNPNYFGNLEASPYKAVLPLAGNTYYEELGCVGYQPQQEMLEGVVYVYQPGGYGSGLCGAGSTEYVRYYLSFDNGLSWQDQGLTSFQVWNVAEGTEGSRRLEFASQLKIDPAQLPCLFGTRLIRMRGILSWNLPPPPNQPNWNPPWGNRREATIAIQPRRWLVLGDLFKTLKVKLPSPLQQAIDLQQPLAMKKAALAPAELAAIYKDTAVPVHRYAYAQIHALAFGKAAPPLALLQASIPGVTLDPALVDLLFPPFEQTDGDTSYEQLRCIGLDPNAPDTLCGVLTIKRASGFNGGPCTAGSTEYVSWWADTDRNGSFETFLGTASVQVHDIAAIPAEGVSMAVRLPVDLAPYRRRCEEGAVVLPVRAILSWSVAVPGNAPDTVPHWGNREETLVHLAPQGVVHGVAGKIAILGGIPVSMISDATGTTNADAVFALNNIAVGADAPFGGLVTVQGAPLPAGYSYKVEVTKEGSGVPVPVLTELTLTRSDGTTHQHDPDPLTQRFAYLPFTDNVNALLAIWSSGGEDRWSVKLSAFDAGGVLISTDSQLIQLDNTRPEVQIAITSGTGNCGKFASGSLISGSFSATDLRIASWSIGVKPPGINDPGEALVSLTPPPLFTTASGSSNEAGTAWFLDTTGMMACGYIVEINAVDHTIVHSQSQGWWAQPASAGFCIEEPAIDDIDPQG